MTGIEIIAAERKRQLEEIGIPPEVDDTYTKRELAQAGAAYALHAAGHPGFAFNMWPWPSLYWNPSPKDEIRTLAKAGALIAAEIDRINRQRDNATQG